MRQRAIRVLESEGAPDGRTNPYITQLYRSLASHGLDVIPWTWRSALFGRYDVLHVHWPEFLLDKRTPLRSLVARTLTRLLLVRLQMTRTPLVRTVHNARPHHGVDERAHRLLVRLDSRVRIWIHLTRASMSAQAKPAPGSARHVLIPHGHYRDWYNGFQPSEPRRGQILLFGTLHRYKRADALLDAFSELPMPDARLTVAGRIPDARYSRELAALADRDDRVRLDGRFMADPELCELITGSELVVLPYADALNSGALLLALSLARPVLTSRFPGAEELRTEVGGAWIRFFEGELSAADLDAALRADGPPATSEPDLSGREWNRIGADHGSLFRSLIVEIGDRSASTHVNGPVVDSLDLDVT